MQAALQPHVDNAISKTINVAASCSFEDFRGIYRQAFEAKLKGCTVFHPNPVTVGLLRYGAGSGLAALSLDISFPPELVTLIKTVLTLISVA